MKKVSLSKSLLQDRNFIENLQRVMEELGDKIMLVEQCCNLNFADEISWNKLQLLGGKYKRSYFESTTIKIWDTSDIIMPTMLSSYDFNVIFHPKSGNLATQETNLLFAADLQDITHILLLESRQIQKKCQTDRKIRKAELKHSIQSGKLLFQLLARKYEESILGFQRKQLTKFMNFEGKSKRSMLRKCFVSWIISRYENGIEQIDRKIINEELLVIRSQKMMLNKYFSSWKSATH